MKDGISTTIFHLLQKNDEKGDIYEKRIWRNYI